MLKADKFCIEQLASRDEAVRSHAADVLRSRDVGHFDEHPLSRKFVLGLQSALAQSYQQTGNTLVRDWIMQVFADVQARGPDIVATAKSALRPDCGFLPTLLYYISNEANDFRDCKEQIKALCKHPDEEVRWRCVYVLNELPLDYDDDSALLREMMPDSFYNTRTYAVLAFKKLRRVEAADYVALQEVLRIDDGAASSHAQDVLAGRFDTYCSADPLAGKR